jgi:hypothetical protein
VILGVWLVYNSAATLEASIESVWPYIDAALFIDGDYKGHAVSEDATVDIINRFASRAGGGVVGSSPRTKLVEYMSWTAAYPWQKRNACLRHDLGRAATWIWQVDSDEVWTEQGAQWVRLAASESDERCHAFSTGLIGFTHSFAYYHWPTSRGSGRRLFRAHCMGPWDHQPGGHERQNWRCGCEKLDICSPFPFHHYQLFQTREQAHAKLERHLSYEGHVPQHAREAAWANDFFLPTEELLTQRRLVPFDGRHPAPMERLYYDRIRADYADADRTYY